MLLNVAVVVVMFSLLSFLYLSFCLAAFFHHHPLIEFNCLCSGVGDRWTSRCAIFTLSLLLCVALAHSLPLPLDRLFHFYTHTQTVRALFYRIFGCLFVYISGKYFCFPFCLLLPNETAAVGTHNNCLCV